MQNITKARKLYKKLRTLILCVNRIRYDTVHKLWLPIEIWAEIYKFIIQDIQSYKIEKEPAFNILNHKCTAWCTRILSQGTCRRLRKEEYDKKINSTKNKRQMMKENRCHYNKIVKQAYNNKSVNLSKCK
jgi:hypothetical protein